MGSQRIAPVLTLAAALGLFWMVPLALTVIGLPLALALFRSSFEFIRAKKSLKRATSDPTDGMEHIAEALRHYAAFSLISLVVVPVISVVVLLALVGV